MKPTNQRKAYIFAVIAILFWSTMSSAFKLTLNLISVELLLFWSSLFGFCALVFLNQFSKTKFRFKQVTSKEVIQSAIMGLFNPFLYYLILFKAYQLLEAQLAGTLNYLWPLLLVVLSGLFLKQRIRLISYLALLISFIGLLIISTKGELSLSNLENHLGVALAISSALIWAIYWILNMRDPREETGKIMMNIFFGLVYLSIYLLITRTSIFQVNYWALAGCLYIGLFEMSLTFVIWLKALQYSADTAKVSNLIYLSPFIGLFFIYLLVGESIHISTIVGLSVVIAGILLQEWPRRKN